MKAICRPTGLRDVSRGDDGDRFALVGDGDGDGLVGLFDFEVELLEGFGEFGGGDGHGVCLDEVVLILAISMVLGIAIDDGGVFDRG
jgi:hypothetical protein